MGPRGRQAAEIGGLEEKLGAGGTKAGALLPPCLKLGKFSPSLGRQFRGRRGRGELGKRCRVEAGAGSGTRVGRRPGSGPQPAVRRARPGRCPLPPLGAAWLPPPPHLLPASASCPDITPSPRQGPAFALCPPPQPLSPLPAPRRGGRPKRRPDSPRPGRRLDGHRAPVLLITSPNWGNFSRGGSRFLLGSFSPHLGKLFGPE